MPREQTHKPFPIQVDTEADGRVLCAHCRVEIEPHSIGMLIRWPDAPIWLPLCSLDTRGMAAAALIGMDLAEPDITIAVV